MVVLAYNIVAVASKQISNGQLIARDILTKYYQYINIRISINSNSSSSSSSSSSVVVVVVVVVVVA